MKSLAEWSAIFFGFLAAALWAYASFQKVENDPTDKSAKFIEHTGSRAIDVLATARRQTYWNGWAALAASLAALSQALTLVL
jgi:hypothetical protein